MSSMPMPPTTARRATSGAYGYGWQSLIASQCAAAAGAVSTTEGPACDLDLQSLPSMIDDSRSGDHGIRAAHGTP